MMSTPPLGLYIKALIATSRSKGIIARPVMAVSDALLIVVGGVEREEDGFTTCPCCVSKPPGFPSL